MDITTADIIGAIESGGDAYALRFEPAWRYFSDDVTARIMTLHKCSRDTARMIASCSYGKFQIMGQALFEQGFHGHIIKDYIQAPGTQLFSFNTFMGARNINFSPADLCIKARRDAFALHYNGDTSGAYSEKIAQQLILAGKAVQS